MAGIGGKSETGWAPAMLAPQLDATRRLLDFARDPMAFVHDRSSAFRRSSLLIVGCGDIGMRVAALLRGRLRLLALTSSRGRIGELRAAGLTPLVGNLDEPASLARLANLADALLHLAPPQPSGTQDRRTAALLHAMARGGRLRRVVYVSTSGVYGGGHGARVDETFRPSPGSDRARRRLDAEQRLRWYARAFGVRVSVLRAPGIYALDREGGNPVLRVARGVPLPERADAVCSNHIHADDLARACVAALMRGRPQRAVNVSDDSELTLGGYFDAAAAAGGHAPLPRVALGDTDATAGDRAAVYAASAESRRLVNRRMKMELRLRLRYPTVADGLAAPQPRP